MTRLLTQRELRNRSGEVMRALDRGESFIVTRNGVPVGELTPLRRKTWVNTDLLREALAGIPGEDLMALRADLDAVVDQDPTPRA